MVFGQDVAQPWPGMMAIARLSQVCGLVALLIGARRRDYLLVVGGMLVAAGNMYYYAALYLLPVFVLESRPTKGSVPVEWAKGSVPAESSVRGYVVAEYLLWFVLGCPLQLIILGHAANGVFCNLALMGLMTMRIARGKPR